jgi:hypothetical protein
VIDDLADVAGVAQWLAGRDTVLAVHHSLVVLRPYRHAGGGGAGGLGGVVDGGGGHRPGDGGG